MRNKRNASNQQHWEGYAKLKSGYTVVKHHYLG